MEQEKSQAQRSDIASGLTPKPETKKCKDKGEGQPARLSRRSLKFSDRDISVSII